MPAAEVTDREILDRVRQMPPCEFDAFIEHALSLRAKPVTTTLSPEATKLVRRINRGLPDGVRQRYARLVGRRKKGTLTADEHQELLHLTHEVETRDADRAAAIVKLAKLRSIPVRSLIEQMGINPRPIHG